MKLFPHQIDVLKQTEDKNRVAYYLDMGLGWLQNFCWIREDATTQ